MTISAILLTEYEEEMAATRLILERVPEDKFAWVPHPKSYTLGALVNHIASIPLMPAVLLRGEPATRSEAASKAEILQTLEANVAVGRQAIASASDFQLTQTVQVSPSVYKPKWSVLRRMLMNHLIHHRGQLTVYLRLLEVPVPGMYGPSADEKA